MTAARGPVFCTLLDRFYLPQGLALLASLDRHVPGMRLWVLALDERCERLLAGLGHPGLHLLTLPELETSQLRQARADRSWGEYCWTLTPFLPEAVLERDREASAVTYIDADCWLAGSVAPLLERFEASGGACMITPHAYSPQRDKSQSAGTYCVQFMPFRRGSGSLTILRWWQDRCVERCSGELGQGPLGDQGYLEDWPERFGSLVFVCDLPALTLAPWNIERFWGRETVAPCLYHFQGFRLFRWANHLVIRASAGVPLPNSAIAKLHRPYLRDILAMLRRLPAGSLPPKILPSPTQDLRGTLLLLPRLLFRSWLVWLRPLPAALRKADGLQHR
jgi:hypothetical protein